MQHPSHKQKYTWKTRNTGIPSKYSSWFTTFGKSLMFCNLVIKTRKPNRKSESQNIKAYYSNSIKKTKVELKIILLPQIFKATTLIACRHMHGTKLIEYWKIRYNDIKLLLDTLKKIKRANSITNNDKDSQIFYILSSKWLKSEICKHPVSRVANYLSNRKARWFFSYLKGFYLNYKS